MAKSKARTSTTPTLRDEEIFHFLWKWKLATFKTLARIFFAKASLPVVYQRLSKLRRAGFLRQRIDESGRNRIWTLDAKGFVALGNRLPELEEYGFASENIEHDLIVNALHLGEWAEGCPEGVELFTEQQLRRMKAEMYPAWVPRTKNHRPDGYWHFAHGEHHLTIAIEVELSTKSKDRYESIVKFYDHYDIIDFVLWLVPTPKLARVILKSASGPNFYRNHVHNFLALEDFQSQFWQASIFSGPNKGSTVHDLLNQNLLQTLLKSPLRPSTKGSSGARSQHLLDTRLSPQNHDEKVTIKIRHFPD
ncbi:MAG: hypothetical protein IPK68_12370 [Bdellovibrionales bacterium]|nr:hypothetical protein [Bdellovibrionales bacterium]